MGRKDVPIRIEIEVDLLGVSYAFVLALELQGDFKELSILEESLSVNGKMAYSRDRAQVTLVRPKGEAESEAKFLMDWHLVALPVIQERSPLDPLFIFKKWLARMIILRPQPGLIKGESIEETLEPVVDGTNFSAWFAGLLAYAPAAYVDIDKYLKQVMPDLKDIRNIPTGTDARSLEVRFASESEPFAIPFDDLSDGEECFMLSALVLASNRAYGPAFCFWDEPDNYLAPSEVGHFTSALRRAFQSSGQFIATSHNPEAISRFSHENTFVLQRKNHSSPCVVRSVESLDIKGDFLGMLLQGELDS